MHNTRNENLDIARRFVNGELTRKEAQAMIGGGRNSVYYWANEYKRSIGDQNVPPKQYQAKYVKDEVANEDEISRLSSLTKEEFSLNSGRFIAIVFVITNRAVFKIRIKKKFKTL